MAAAPLEAITRANALAQIRLLNRNSVIRFYTRTGEKLPTFLSIVKLFNTKEKLIKINKYNSTSR